MSADNSAQALAAVGAFAGAVGTLAGTAEVAGFGFAVFGVAWLAGYIRK